VISLFGHPRKLVTQVGNTAQTANASIGRASRGGRLSNLRLTPEGFDFYAEEPVDACRYIDVLRSHADLIAAFAVGVAALVLVKSLLLPRSRIRADDLGIKGWAQVR
jgi:hypothetical protein